MIARYLLHLQVLHSHFGQEKGTRVKGQEQKPKGLSLGKKKKNERTYIFPKEIQLHLTDQNSANRYCNFKGGWKIEYFS